MGFLWLRLDLIEHDSPDTRLVDSFSALRSGDVSCQDIKTLLVVVFVFIDFLLQKLLFQELNVLGRLVCIRFGFLCGLDLELLGFKVAELNFRRLSLDTFGVLVAFYVARDNDGLRTLVEDAFELGSFLLDLIVHHKLVQ